MTDDRMTNCIWESLHILVIRITWNCCAIQMFKYKIICEKIKCNFSFQDLGFHKVRAAQSVARPCEETWVI